VLFFNNVLFFTKTDISQLWQLKMKSFLHTSLRRENVESILFS